jgi:hypothetical protein
VSMFVEDMSRNNCFFQVLISHVLYLFVVSYLLTLLHTLHVTLFLFYFYIYTIYAEATRSE